MATPTSEGSQGDAARGALDAAAAREVRTRERAKKVYEVTAALSRAQSEEAIAALVLGEVASALHADAAVAYTMKDGHLVLLGSRGVPASVLSARGVLPLDSPLPLAVVAQTREPLWAETHAELIERYPLLRDSRTSPALLQAVVALPLLDQHDVLLGAVAFSFSTPQVFDADTRIYASTLVNHAALGMERTMLRRDEAATHSRLQLLAEASKVFAETSLDLQQALDVIAREVATRLGDTCAINLLREDGAVLEHVASHSLDPAEDASARATMDAAPVRMDEGSALAQVVRTGETLLVPTVPRQRMLGAVRPEYRAHFERFPIGSLLVVPLRARSGIIGTMTATRGPQGLPFGAADRVLLEDLAHRAALCIANAQDYAALSRERGRLAFLARASALLQSSLDYEATLQNVIQLALPELGDFGFFDVVEGESVRRIARAHEDERRHALIATTSWVRSERRDMNLCALSSGEPGHHAVIDDAWLEKVAAGPEHLAMMRALDFGSMITVPLRCETRCTGALTLFFNRGGRRRHTLEDVRLAGDLAQRAAAVVENARLLRQLEEAVRVRDDFLSVAGHELRTPLTALTLQLESIKRQDGAAAFADRIQKTERYTNRLVRLVNDLLDVSRMSAGGLRMTPQRMDLIAVTRECAEMMQEMAKTANSPVHLVGDEVVHGFWDVHRIEQVIVNLVSNALKFGKGGRVEIDVRAEAGVARISVRDHGLGVSAGDEARIFERFERGASHKNYGGLGLGLWIVRRVAEAHGGRARFERPVGGGARFVVELPIVDEPSAAAN